MSAEPTEIPRVFTSYSWTSSEHREWVRLLVDRLRGDGVDVVLDVYELKEGQDKYAYMERMVSDPKITKVMVLSDRKYAEKADAREGGVGTESTIISQEVYNSVDQQKFIPVVTEFDEQGKPYLPTFMKSRIYIDFSSEEKLAENYEMLLRSLFDKPMYEKPGVGKPPSFLLEGRRTSTKTGFKLQLLKDAILKNRPTVRGLVADYLDSFQFGLEDFQFKIEEYNDISKDKVLSSIHEFLPYRDEFIDFILFVSQYTDDANIYQNIFEFLEGALRFRNPPKGTSGFDHLRDNFRFILPELFLYLIAALIKNQRYEVADTFLSQQYFDADTPSEYESYVSFTVFSTDSQLIEVDAYGRNTGETAKLLRERASHKELNFNRIMETDFVLFVRSLIHRESQYDWVWLPRSVISAQYGSVFELFSKAESHRRFENLKVLLRIASKEELQDKFNKALENGVSGIALRSITVKTLLNLERLDTCP